MAKNKYTLITIIVLLVIFVPAAIYGTIMNFTQINNRNKELKFGGKLNFYVDDQLIGTYECQTSQCDYATFKNGTKSTLISGFYVFVDDGNVIKLLDLNNNSLFGEYTEVDMMEDVYLVEQNNLWGALTINFGINQTIELLYDEIIYKDGVYLVRIGDDKAFIKDGTETFKTRLDIQDFNEYFITVLETKPSCDTCTDMKANYLVYDYNSNVYFINESINDNIWFVDNYFLIKRSSNYVVYTIDNHTEIELGSFVYDESEEIRMEKEDDKINIYGGDNLQKSIELNS